MTPPTDTLRLANASLQDEVARREEAEHALFIEKERYRVTLSAVDEAVVTTDEAGRIVFLNPVAEQLTGWTSPEALGQHVPLVLRVEDPTRQPLLMDLLGWCLTGTKTALPEHTRIIRRDGESRAIGGAVAPIRDARGETTGCAVIFRDVTERRDSARRLAYQATHDSLTGLVNRAEFERRLTRVVDSCAPHDAHALLYLDLDQFKIVNDTCGHAAGDELLRQICGLLQRNVRRRDTLARLGGDEFAVLLEHCAIERAQLVAEHALRAVQAFRFQWQDRGFTVGVSIGVVPVTEESGSVQEIMGAADRACYAAKDQGRNRIHLYRADDAVLAQRHDQMQWIPRIQRALADDRFALVFQPVVSLSSPSSRVEHCEVLLRLIDDNGDVVLPGAFIPAAERFDHMLALDRWVVEHVLDVARGWSPGSGPATISVNISAQSLCDPQFRQFVVTELGTSAVASRLCFEITETAAISHYAHTLAFVAELRPLGCRFALDDFGSGLASFPHLKTLHVDFLKIDGRLINGILGDAVDRAVVKAIHQIAHVADVKTIAECVEDERTAIQLQLLGVDYAQGWYFGVPCARDRLLQMEAPVFWRDDGSVRGGSRATIDNPV